MDGRGGRAVGEAGRAALERLSRSAARREADRARAVLWSLGDETSTVIATRLGVRAEQVRRWRSAFRRGGAEALRSRPRPGRTPRKREAALAVARDVPRGPAARRRGRPPGSGPGAAAAPRGRRAAEVAARAGGTSSPGHLGAVPRKGAAAGAGRGRRHPPAVWR